MRAGTHVDVAWVVDTDIAGEHDRADALAITPGGGRIGSLMSGALDGHLVDQARRADRGRLVTLDVSEVDALVAGLTSGGAVRCLLVPAIELPSELWELLIARRPACLVSHLGADAGAGAVVTTTLFTAETIDAAGDAIAARFRDRHSDVVSVDDAVVTLLWPTPRLLVVGGGPFAEALVVAARPLGWHTQVTNEVATATGVIAGMASIDKLVVAAHDLELAGPVLAAALDGDVGYIGAVGGRRMQESRAEWLAYRGITELDRINAPAGLDIGAESPAEVAIAILAEALALTPPPAAT
jgi:xanthine dehydrogenase accessory factor